MCHGRTWNSGAKNIPRKQCKDSSLQNPHARSTNVHFETHSRVRLSVLVYHGKTTSEIGKSDVLVAMTMYANSRLRGCDDVQIGTWAPACPKNMMLHFQGIIGLIYQMTGHHITKQDNTRLKLCYTRNGTVRVVVF